jgi:hypothetical protein
MTISASFLEYNYSEEQTYCNTFDAPNNNEDLKC